MKRRAILAAGGTLGIALGIALTILFLASSPQNAGNLFATQEGKKPESAPEIIPPLNVFLPPEPSSSLSWLQIEDFLSRKTEALPQSDAFDIVESISEIIGPTSIVLPPGGETLPLPPVAAGEFPVRKNGAATIEDYMAQVTANSSRVSLTKKEFDQLLKRPGGRIMRPTELIELALHEKTFSGIQNSLKIFLDLYAKEDMLFRAVEVSPPGVPIAEQIIGMGRLTKTMMENAVRVNAGGMSEKDFRDFYEKYTNTSRAVSANLASKSDPSKPRSLAERIETSVKRLSSIFSGLISSAFAQSGSQPFGGDIEEVTSDGCYCSGEKVTLDENYVQGGGTDFLYSYATMFSGTYANNAVEQNTCSLGIYSQPGTCVSGDECEETEEEDGSIIMIGTASGGSQCSSDSAGSGGGSSGNGF